jgi:hypothetical protein
MAMALELESFCEAPRVQERPVQVDTTAEAADCNVRARRQTSTGELQ